MLAFIKKYIWLWEMIAAAIVIACGVIIVTVKPVLYIIIGFILALLGLFRIIPLVKTTDDKVLKWMNVIELSINVIVGTILIILGFASNGGNQKLENFINKNFGYFIGAIFFLRGLVYFYTTTIKKEDTNYPLFVIHVILFSLGSFIIGLTICGNFEYNTVKWTVFAIALLAAGFTGYNGIKGYINYRGNEQNEKATKKVKKVNEKSEKEIEAPTNEQIINKIEDNDSKDDVPTIQA